jgi:hypothetical protein
MRNDMEAASGKVEQRLATLSFISLAFLGLLFILGMYTNMYVEFPEGSNGWKVVGGNLIATLHMALGSLFVIAALALLIGSIVSKRFVWIVWSAVGFVASAVAAYSGTSFVSAQSNGTSFTMALGFFVAFLSYAAAIHFGRRRT